MGIDASFVVITEPRYLHVVYAVSFFDVDIEVAHQIGCEVELRYLEEQLVLVVRVGLIGQQERKVGLTVGAEALLDCLFFLVENHATALPYVL